MKVQAKKSLGQHFLFDQNICAAIVSSCIPIAGEVVVEVGPGHGSLTKAILQKEPKQLFLIEKDHLLAEKLKEQYSHSKQVTVIEGDAMKVNMRTLTDEQFIIISNLPYNVGTQLLCDWLCYSRDAIKHMTLMLQKEVIDRICALTRTKDYGRLSILCQLLADCQKSFDVGPQYFTPPPKVTSSIVQISPIQREFAKEEFKIFQNVLRSAFSSRRKMLKSALKDFLKEDDFLKLNIAPSLRPEELSVEEFWSIAHEIYINAPKN
jgi:16S rRNA (adenine1518-N6/adenine1519-N6)-dimethyltransferase